MPLLTILEVVNHVSPPKIKSPDKTLGFSVQSYAFLPKFAIAAR